MPGDRVVQQLRRAVLILLVSAALFSLVSLVYSGRDSSRSFSQWFAFPLVALWNLLPYWVLAAVARLRTESRGQAIVVLLGSCAVVAFGVWQIVTVIYLRPLTYGGLIFVALPIYQSVGCLATVALVWLLGRVAGGRIIANGGAVGRNRGSPR